MAEARGREAWARASALMALVANAHRDPRKGRAFRPSDFDPHELEEKRRPIARTRDLGILKRVFVKREEKR